MIGQRADTKEAGLPRTACAPDLFTRIDGLKAGAAAHADFPVRWYLGFATALPDFQQLRGDGLVWRIAVAFGGKPNDGAVLRRGKDLAVGILIIVIWILGFLADVMTTAKLGLGGKNDPVIREISAEIAAKELTARLTGGDPEWATAIDRAARDYLVPTVTIAPGEAVGAYLANVIDVQAAGDYGKLAGVCQVATDIAVETQQSRPDPQTMLSLWHRGLVNEDRAEQQIREQGWLKSEYVQWQKELWWQTPSAGEFVSWMRAGYQLGETVKYLKLDAGFDANFDADAKRWAEAAGLREEAVKRLWRSTYQWPSAGEAIDWFRRSQAGLLPVEDLVSEQRLQEIIAHGTTPPKFQGAVFASRFTPLSARLLRTAYDEDVADERQVTAALLADGFSQADAEILLGEWRQLKPKYTASKVGLPGVGKLYSLYADATIGSRDFLAGCARLGLNSSQAGEALQGARNERMVKHRAELLKTVKASYMTGAVDDATVHVALGQLGLDAADVGELSAFWRAEFEARPRPDQAGELGKAYQSGYISETEYVASLTQLRYTPGQIARILVAAGFVEAAKRLGDAEKLVGATRKRLTAEQKEMVRLIDQAEKLAGKVEQRTRTNAGKLMGWIKSRVAKPPKRVSEKGPANGQTYVETSAALAQAAAFVEGKDSGAAASGTGIAIAGEGSEVIPDEQTD